MDRIHHVAIFTTDCAATVAFYREVFGAEASDTPTQPSVVRVGGAILHVFEHGSGGASWSPTHLHHIALQASDLDEFVAVRSRLLARGACHEEVIDFGVGAHVSVLATDPDGGMLEVLVAIDDRGSLPFPVTPHRT